MSDTTISPENTEEVPNERRALLRKLAIGGAGAAAGAVLLNHGTASAGDQAALPQTNGNAVELGEVNTATLPTVIKLTAAVPAATDPVPAAFGIESNAAHLRLVPGAVTGPTPGDHTAGELYLDKDGTLWFTVPAPTTADATAVRFVKLAGTPASGSFHAITPQRAYDSRQPNYTVKGALAPNTNRVISVADGHGENGTVTLANAVPAGATAVEINVTAANMTGPNFLSVTAGNVATIVASLLNWGPGDIQIANSVSVAVDATRQIKVFCGNQTGSTDVIIDVYGYYI